MEELVLKFYQALAVDSLENVVKEFFQYPEKKEFIIIIHSKLESMVLHNEASEPMVDMYKLLSSILENPSLIYDDNYADSAELLELMKTEQLEHSTTSVEYVNGNLMYCVKQQPNNFMFDKSFVFDSMTNFTKTIETLRAVINSNPNAEYGNLLKARITLLKKLNGLVDTMKTPMASVKVEKLSTRPKIQLDVVDNCTVFVVA